MRAGGRLALRWPVRNYLELLREGVVCLVASRHSSDMNAPPSGGAVPRARHAHQYATKHTGDYLHVPLERCVVKEAVPQRVCLVERLPVHDNLLHQGVPDCQRRRSRQLLGKFLRRTLLLLGILWPRNLPPPHHRQRFACRLKTRFVGWLVGWLEVHHLHAGGRKREDGRHGATAALVGSYPQGIFLFFEGFSLKLFQI